MTTHVHHMYITCTSHVHHMYITCTSHVHHMYTCTMYNVHIRTCTYIIRESHVNTIRHIVCTLYIYVRVLSTGGGGGGAGGKLPPQNLVTDHRFQEIFGLNCIKSDLWTPKIQNISWGILPQTPYTLFTSVVGYYFHCTLRRFPPKVYF